MVKRFPVRPKSLPPKKAACEAMGLNMTPVLRYSHNVIIPLPESITSGNKANPSILYFPVRTA